MQKKTLTKLSILSVLLLSFAAVLPARAEVSKDDPKPGSFFDGSSAAPAAISEAAKTAAAKKMGGAGPLADDDRYWVILTAPDKAARQRIVDAGVSIENVSAGKVAGVATPKALEKLAELGIRVEKKTALRSISTEDFPNSDQVYHNHARMESELKSIASSNQGLASVFAIGKGWQGRSILALRLNTTEQGSKPSQKPGAVFMGAHHAREHLSVETPLLIARWIVDNRDRADVKKLLETRDVYFIPMVNPDGAEYDIATGSYRWQRKNMRKNPGGSIGVDLNRNFGWGWGGAGSSGDQSSDIYHGPSAFSEPETQAVRDFLSARPNIKTLISFHSFSELVLYPWGGQDDPISDPRALKAYKAMAAKMAKWNGYTPQQSSDLYVATGDTCDWAWGEKKIFSFTFELTPRSQWAGGFYPGPDVIGPTVQKNIEPVLYMIGLADDPYRAADEGASELDSVPSLGVVK
ncbi:MAG: zinc carboxypeptidase [Elusimicrobia bacterium]|nr:zinc carboxypeptidase [Elusimicrobiota bacterium]